MLDEVGVLEPRLRRALLVYSTIGASRIDATTRSSIRASALTPEQVVRASARLRGTRLDGQRPARDVAPIDMGVDVITDLPGEFPCRSPSPSGRRSARTSGWW
ncbi:MAG: hypothetical protein R3D28_22450 [Geminicoccaceae bacterium]